MSPAAVASAPPAPAATTAPAASPAAGAAAAPGTGAAAAAGGGGSHRGAFSVANILGKPPGEPRVEDEYIIDRQIGKGAFGVVRLVR